MSAQQGIDVPRLAMAMRSLLPNKRILIESYTMLRDRDGSVPVYANDDALLDLAEAIATEYDDEPIANCPECEAPIGAGSGCEHWPVG